MIYTQRSIFLSLRLGGFTTRNALETVRTVQRQHKVAKILAVLSCLVRSCLWRLRFVGPHLWW